MPAIITDPDLAQKLRSVVQQLTDQLSPQGIGVSLFMFRINDMGSPALFGTNIDKKQMVEAVGNWVDAERARAQVTLTGES